MTLWCYPQEMTDQLSPLTETNGFVRKVDQSEKTTALHASLFNIILYICMFLPT